MSLLISGDLRLAKSFTQWTPADITTALWLDAADASTVTLNGSTVSQWNDKSGNSRHVSQSTAGQQPTWNATGLNSKPTLVFDGSNDILLNQNAGSIGVTHISMFVVMRYVSASGEDLPFGIGTTGSVGQVRCFYRGSGGTTQGFATWALDIPSSSLSTDTGGTHHIFEAVQGNSSSISLFRDGVAATGNPLAFPGATDAVDFNGVSLGSLQGAAVGNYYSSVAISEAILIYSEASTNTRQRIEGYLAHKWGLTANLPADHPYKVNPPAP
jgi:hypothetical protein